MKTLVLDLVLAAVRADAAKLAYKNVGDFILPNGHHTANFKVALGMAVANRRHGRDHP